MKEDSVFWFGHRPGARETGESPAEDPAFQGTIADCCEAAGFSVTRFIAAQGRYGTWLVEGESGGAQRRILWNGREKRLVLQKPLPGGGWEDPADVAVNSEDAEGFREGIRRLLAEPGTTG